MHALRHSKPMKLSFKAILIGLIATSGWSIGSAQAAPPTCPAGAASCSTETYTSPLIMEADVSAPGIGWFSGIGTGQYRNQTGTSQNLNVGMTAGISASTNVESTPEYFATGTATANVTGGDYLQSFGITSQIIDNSTTTTTETGGIKATDTTTSNAADDLISGKFNGSFNTTVNPSSGATNSEVDLSGVSSATDLDLTGSIVDLATDLRDTTAAKGENGSGSAVGNIAISTTASAGIQTAEFSSGFIQTFAPTGAAAINYTFEETVN